MSLNLFDDLDHNTLPFIDPEDLLISEQAYWTGFDVGQDVTYDIAEANQRNVIEAVSQVQTCISNLEDHANRANRKEAKDILAVIRKDLAWENYPDLRHKVHLLQSLLYRAA